MKDTSLNDAKLNKMAILLSVASATIIIIAKSFGWLITGSQSMFASLADSILDILSSSINMLAVYYATKPADENYRFGRSKAEDLAVFFQAAFFGSSGIFVIVTSTHSLFFPKEITNIEGGLWVILISLVVTSLLITFHSFVISRTKSNVIKADRIHYAIDIFSNIGVIISLYCASKYKLFYIDSLFAIFCSIAMIVAAFKLIVRAFANLMDQEFDLEKKKLIIETVKSFPEILGIHDLKTRRSGSKLFIQLHIELDGELTLNYVHQIAENFTEALEKKFPGADIITHQDPHGVEEKIKFPWEKELLAK